MKKHPKPVQLIVASRDDNRPWAFTGFLGGAKEFAVMHVGQPKQLLTPCRGARGGACAPPPSAHAQPGDTCPWRPQVAPPTPPETKATSSSLSTTKICIRVPSATSVFSNKQITSSLVWSSICNSVRHSGRVCAPPALADLCQHFILQPCRFFSQKKKKSEEFSKL